MSSLLFIMAPYYKVLPDIATWQHPRWHTGLLRPGSGGVGKLV